MWGRGLEILKGKSIRRALISADHTTLAFELADGERQAFYTDGDCCSESWIEHVSNADNLAGSTVTGAEEIEIGDVTASYEGKEAPPQEYVQAYGVKVQLEGRPSFELEFRNASNGYYGGSIEATSLDDKQWAALAELREDF